jgi:hypothetical protein
LLRHWRGDEKAHATRVRQQRGIVKKVAAQTGGSRGNFDQLKSCDRVHIYHVVNPATMRYFYIHKPSHNETYPKNYCRIHRLIFTNPVFYFV